MAAAAWGASAAPVTEARVSIRFQRLGRKKKPFYRIVAMESRKARNAAYLAQLGWYNPLTKETYINAQETQKWLANGAQPSDTVHSLLKRALPNLVVAGKE